MRIAPINWLHLAGSQQRQTAAHAQTSDNIRGPIAFTLMVLVLSSEAHGGKGTAGSAKVR